MLLLALHELMFGAGDATHPAPKGVSGSWPELRALADAARPTGV